MNDNENKTNAPIKLPDCPHEKFNSGHQQRCESGCGHTRDYILGYQAALNEADALRADLDQAITHLHWLTVGGEFATEAFDGKKEWSLGASKEFGQAQVFLKDFRLKQHAAIKPKDAETGEQNGK